MSFSASSTSHRALRRGLTFAGLLAVLLMYAFPALAHVGSPDVYAEGTAGPYRLLVTVRPPQVIPGVAEIEVRVVAAGGASASVSGIEIAPIPLTGEASKHPPVADAMKASAADPHFFTGALWIMASGSWQVRFQVHGEQGAGVLSIPVPATSSSTLGMQKGMATMLGGLGLLLVMGVIGIVGAAVRDAQLPPGAPATETGRKRSRVAMGFALALAIAAVVFGKWWWGREASDYSAYVYKPLTMQASVDDGKILSLKLEDPGWLKSRKLDDFVLDHDHLMHLYLIREPGLDVVYHLHPDQAATGRFALRLPSMPAGRYRLYADVVHATGFPETLVTLLDLPAIDGRALEGDDAKGVAPPLAKASSCTVNGSAEFGLPDGDSMVWTNPAVLPARTPQVFAFQLRDAQGQPARDTTLYMGMLGHAAFVKGDGSVFAHVHPSGTPSMAAMMMAEALNGTSPDQSKPAMGSMAMPGMAMPGAPATLPSSVGFPYGFPTPGVYRIFVQMKHGNTVETASFDACAR